MKAGWRIPNSEVARILRGIRVTNYQTAGRKDNCTDCQHARLIADAEFWARKGERTFWHWYQTLTTDQRRVVKAYMNDAAGPED